jgi:CHAD domain-containing protein
MWRKWSNGVLVSASYHGIFMAQVNASPGVALRIFADAWPRAMRGEPKAVHAVRVASRRLREALRLIGQRKRESRKLARELKRLTRLLGPVRELDVSRTLVGALAAKDPDLAAACERVDAKLLEIVTVRRQRLAKGMAGIDEKELIDRLGHILRRSRPGGRLPAESRQRLSERIASRAGDAAEAADSAGALYAPEALHEARIRTKKLRYALEVGRAARIPGAARAATSLRSYQDLLGELHDYQVLSAQAARLQSRLPLEDDDIGAISDLLATVETRCRKLHAEFVSRRAALVTSTYQLEKAFSARSQSTKA